MKRLLLAPLLLAISGCSSDIVVKTDLGEKYIVKESSVKTQIYGLDDAIYLINGMDNLIDQHAYRNMMKKEKTEDHFYFVEFRPIFIDLNNVKKANTKYEKIACINEGNLNSNTELFWNQTLKIHTLKPKQKSNLAYEKMKYKVCEKYAKFDKKEG